MDYDPHPALRPLVEAAAQLSGIEVFIVPMNLTLAERIPPRWQYSAKILGAIIAHLKLPFRLALGHNNVIVLREFLSWPLIVVWPLIAWRRRRTYFLVHHQFQKALGSRRELMALRILNILGAKLVTIEVLPPRPMSNFVSGVIPHPLPMIPVDRSRCISRIKRHGTLRIGIIGRLRDEKGSEWLFDVLPRALRGHDDLETCLACDDPKQLETARSRGWIALTTKEEDDYRRALESLDIAVFAYSEDRYRYRASGVVSECIAYDTFPIVPDFPAMRSQVEYPAVVGATYKPQDEESLRYALTKAVQDIREGYSAIADRFEQHRKARGVDSIAYVLSKLTGDTI